MHPIICQIGPFPVYSFGLMLATAVFLCTFLLQKEAQKKGFDPNVIVDFVFWIVVSGIIGSRLFYIALNLSYFMDNPSEIIMLQRGGLAWQGGLVFGVLAALFFIKRKKLPLKEIADLSAPYLALGQAIGRIGCFLNGCCYGKEVSWGIYFPVHHARLYPTQLFDSLGLFLIFLFLKKYQALQKNSGETFVLYLLSASLLRFFVEFFRADHTILILNLSIFQIVSMIIIVLAIYAYLFPKGRSGK